MNRGFQVHSPSKAAEHRRTPKRWRVGYGARTSARFWSAPAAAALWMSNEVMVPMHAEKRKGALQDGHSGTPAANRTTPADRRFESQLGQPPGGLWSAMGYI